MHILIESTEHELSRFSEKCWAKENGKQLSLHQFQIFNELKQANEFHLQISYYHFLSKTKNESFHSFHDMTNKLQFIP